MMKKFNLELAVGFFILAGFLCFVYLSMQLGEVSIFAGERNYTLVADFDNISGLKEGALIEIAGVNVGKVAKVMLGKDDRARVYLQVSREVLVTEDSVASVRTQGIIGDKYLRIIQGGSEDILRDGDFVTETESAVDIEELVSKYIFGDV